MAQTTGVFRASVWLARTHWHSYLVGEILRNWSPGDCRMLYRYPAARFLDDRFQAMRRSDVQSVRLYVSALRCPAAGASYRSHLLPTSHLPYAGLVVDVHCVVLFFYCAYNSQVMRPGMPRGWLSPVYQGANLRGIP